MQRTDFSFLLPPALIAQTPGAERDGSRLLTLPRNGGLQHQQFRDLPGLLRAGDVLVVNDTRVIKARLRAQKDSGGAAELLVERAGLPDRDRHALCQVRVSKPLKAGRELRVGEERLRVLGRDGEFYVLEFPEPVLTFLDRWGEVPLPPYVERAPADDDETRYQTVFGRAPGAVAAPTAGLHFTETLLSTLDRQGVERCAVTLHVGAGTFQPVRVDALEAHKMHFERYAVPAEAAERINAAKADGRRIVAVGTTVVRTLEAASEPHGGVRTESGETDLFITPGYRFRTVDALITNFHLPESTLLMLVCAFAGYDRVMAAYREAVAERYRFFSYGDAMYCEQNTPAHDAGGNHG